MSDKNWICPCNGCKKARNQAFAEIEKILDENIYDAPYAIHLTYTHIRKETGNKKDAKKSSKET